MQNDEARSRPRGRPKDPLLEGKILQAAAQVYGRLGWSGFTFDAVAREARVGKSTIYARWSHAAELLGYLIEQRWQALEEIDTGTLKGDLLAFGHLVLNRYRETGGGIAWHLRRDIATYPELSDHIGPAVNRSSNMCITILRRARERGDLREGVSLSLTAELLTSALESYTVRHRADAQSDEASDSSYIAKVMQLLRCGIEAGL